MSSPVSQKNGTEQRKTNVGFHLRRGRRTSRKTNKGPAVGNGWYTVRGVPEGQRTAICQRVPPAFSKTGYLRRRSGAAGQTAGRLRGSAISPAPRRGKIRDGCAGISNLRQKNFTGTEGRNFLQMSPPKENAFAANPRRAWPPTHFLPLTVTWNFFRSEATWIRFQMPGAIASGVSTKV